MTHRWPALRALHRLWLELGATGYQRRLVVYSLSAVGFSSTFILPLFYSQLVGSLNGTVTIDVSLLSAATALLLLIGYASEHATDGLAATANARICQNLTNRHLNACIDSDIAVFERTEIKQHIAAISDLLELLQSQQLYLLQQFIRSVFIALITIAILPFISLPLFLVTLPLILGICVIPVVVASKATPYIDAEPDVFEDLGAHLQQVSEAADELHFRSIEHVTATTQAHIDRLHHTQLGKWSIWNVSFNLKLTQNFLLYTLVLLVAAGFYFAGNIDLHTVVASYFLITMAAPKFDAVYKAYNFAQACASAYRGLDQRHEQISETVSSVSTPSSLSAPDLITLSIPEFRYQTDHPLVLQNCHFQLRKGQHLLLTGPSGCGKSSLIDLLLGIQTAPGLTVAFDNAERPADKLRSLWSATAYVGNPDMLLPELTVYDNLRLFYPIDEARCEALLDELDLTPLVQRIVRNLSGGERQRVSIVRALASDRPILIFDEPTSALDQARAQRAMSLITQERQRLVLVISHDHSAAVYFDHVVTLHDGKLTDIEVSA